MIHNEIFDKNEIVYSLLSSYNEPNVLVPIKGIVKDIRFEHDAPNYLLKIERFYDNIYFIKSHVKDMHFYTNFNNDKYKLTLGELKTKSALADHLDNKEITIVNHALMTFKSKAEMSDVFDKMNFYFILLNLFNLKHHLNRHFYKGDLKLSGDIEFFDRLKNFFGDKFPTKNGVSFEEIADLINKTKHLNILKYEKVKRNNYIKKK